jgi:site-specific DNA-methyltransferase (adenine-specific)
MKPYYETPLGKLYHGDCLEILPTLPTVDLVLTDPPYGVLSESGSAATRRSGGNGVIAWDVAPTSEVISQLFKVSGQQAIWGGCHLQLPPTLGYLIWDKQIDGLNFGEVEFCWTNQKFAPRIFRKLAVCFDGGKIHPTQKPINLMLWCIGFFEKSDTIIDPFIGSGTTAIACEILGKQWTGIEIEEKYCEIAAKRIEAATWT